MRWRFEIADLVKSFLERSYGYFYVTFIILTASSLLPWIKRKPKPGLWWCPTISNIICIGPFVGIILMFFSGTSSVVQLNTGSEISMGFWSLWVGMFLPFIFGSIASVGLSSLSIFLLLFLIITRSIKQNRSSFAFYVLSSTGFAYFTLYTLIQFAPSV